MKVKLKDPSRIYYDRSQKKTFHGKSVFTTKATGYVRERLNAGDFVEVTQPSAPQLNTTSTSSKEN